MNNFQKDLFAIAIIIVLSVALISKCEAGTLFLDLDLGAHVSDYHQHSTTYQDQNYLGHENPIGIYRIGYQTKPYSLMWKIKLRGHGYFEHGSSVKRIVDDGYNLIMVGGRFEYDL